MHNAFSRKFRTTIVQCEVLLVEVLLANRAVRTYFFVQYENRVYGYWCPDGLAFKRRTCGGNASFRASRLVGKAAGKTSERRKTSRGACARSLAVNLERVQLARRNLDALTWLESGVNEGPRRKYN